MDLSAKMQSGIDDPTELENIYRDNRREFREKFPELKAAKPESMLIQAWDARLNYRPDTKSIRWDAWLVGGLAFLAGTLCRLPEVFTGLDGTEYYMRNTFLGPLLAVLVYLLHYRNWPRPQMFISLAAFGVMAVFVNLIPLSFANVWFLSLVHCGILTWFVLGTAYAGKDLFSRDRWAGFIRFTGEILVYSAILLIGGGILVAMTSGLLYLLDASEDIILRYMIPYGLAAIPVVSALAVTRYSQGGRIAPVVSRLFAPVFLVVIVGYLIILALNLDKLFDDREFLLTYNLILLSVACLSVFSLTGRGSDQPKNVMNGLLTVLLGVTMILDLVALWAISDRIFSMGITPNRLAVFGANVLILANMGLLFSGFWGLYSGSNTVGEVERKQAAYLPIYGVWLGIVAFVFPVIF